MKNRIILFFYKVHTSTDHKVVVVHSLAVNMCYKIEMLQKDNALFLTLKVLQRNGIIQYHDNSLLDTLEYHKPATVSTYQVIKDVFLMHLYGD